MKPSTVPSRSNSMTERKTFENWRKHWRDTKGNIQAERHYKWRHEESSFLMYLQGYILTECLGKLKLNNAV